MRARQTLGLLVAVIALASLIAMAGGQQRPTFTPGIRPEFRGKRKTA